MLFPSFFNAVAPPYQIEQSLRFDGTADLVLTTPATTESINAFTMSCWVKVLHGSDQTQFMGRKGAPNNVNNVWLTHNALGGQGIGSYMYTSSINGRGVLNTDAKYRDYSAWMHVHYSLDSSSGNNQKLYVNGVDVTANTDTISGVLTFDFSSTYPFQIGNASSSKFYLAEYHFISGSRPDYTNFGEEDDNGVWRPIEYTGSYGNNGFYLKFDPSATNGVGHDHSGTGNHFTATGFTTSGTGTDVMSDTPTTNYMTFNPLDTSRDMSSSFYLNNGNLDLNVTNNSSYRNLSATFWPEGLKGYFEVTVSTGTPNFHIGFTDFDRVLTKSDYTVSNVNYYISEAGTVKNGATNIHSGYLSSFSSGDTLGIAFDFTGGNRNVWFSKNGTFGSTSDGAGDPAAGTNPALTTTQLDVEQRFYFAINTGSGLQTISLNTGQRDFENTPPTGFKTLNTKNLPAPTIKDGSDHFNTVTYTGTGASNSRTDVGFQPDFLWIKSRSNTHYHVLVDAVRNNGGSGSFLEVFSNDSASEQQYTGRVTSLDSTGFTVGTDSQAGVNTLNNTYVAWNWLAGGSGSSNTDGSVTSTVSANPTAGFSIVTYTGTGANATVGHGLGAAVDFLLIKSTSNGSSWQAGHTGAGWTEYAHLDLNNNFTSASTVWQDTAPTSTVFSLGTETGVNGLDRTYVAYCFAEVEGYSKFGSYTGNGNADGPFVFTGMAPAFILVKQSSGNENWLMFDTTRKTFNENDTTLSPNVSSAEVTSSTNEYDILSNGFKARNSSAGVNQSGQTYIFAAFAENPFGGFGVSPATAR